ncbi:uncharacterized protein BKA55DRAFT_728688 [Fusarium redolens]|uniref:F-box domain-containing protein n=1 Tax=Fusarium redolens TaxID=48865 RepID=A0A9P9K5E3_FUSRE|nr:uncharacterized protein BKA55DRAFT_728688 [Fusarium redolens]KAH7248608.1 hypothetical protein BKA55DRAFT_728688 [Fusarium redolens]
MRLDTLPSEILAEVCSLGLVLLRQDIKSLRLTCRRLAIETSPILFYRIHISPLLQDFANFFSISRSPGLAPLVRVLVWEELGFDFSYLKDGSWKRQLLDGDQQFFTELTEFVYFLFLLDIQHISGYPTMDTVYHIPGHLTRHMIHDNDPLIPQSNIQDEFVSAIRNNMPNLHTLASRPMDPRRRLQLPSMDYSISVDSLRNLLQENGAALRFNVGFTDFLLPLLESPTTQAKDKVPTSKITRLFYADEGVNSRTALYRMTPLKPSVFKHLSQLDLCLTGKHAETNPFAGLRACLENAKSLTSLKLCNEGTPVPYSPGIIPTLPKLTDVELAETDLLGKTLISQTLKFIQRHAKTLKRLYFTSSAVERSFLAKLADMNSLQLERLVITSGHNIEDGGDNYGNNSTDDGSESDAENRHEYINEQAVLAYVNRADISNQEKPLPPFRFTSGQTQIFTHPLVFDTTTCELAAFNDTRDNLWEKRGYDSMDIKWLDTATLERRDKHGIAYDIGPRRIFHFETGLWVDSDKVFYDPVTDEEADDPLEKREKPKDGSWTVQGQRTWDPEMGLWSDGEGKLKKFATERELPERPEVPDEDEDYDFDIEMQPFYDREEDEYLLRVENSPRWDWGRDTEGRIWYWQVSGTAGHPTEVWRFEHKGEEAYGNDPLEFWGDWFDDEPGDKAEATPYGWNLAAFSADHKTAGSEIPQQGSCESLRRYNREDDPGCHYDIPKPADFEVWTNVSWCEL